MKIEQSEGTVYGIRYYTVAPREWQYLEGSFNWDEIMSWVLDTYGPMPEDGVWTPNARWYVNNSRFWFHDLEDVTLFVLRWS